MQIPPSATGGQSGREVKCEVDARVCTYEKMISFFVCDLNSFTLVNSVFYKPLVGFVVCHSKNYIYALVFSKHPRQS